MDEKFEIRIRRLVNENKYFWKLMKYDLYDEGIVALGLEDTMDSAYKHAKKKYEELAK